MSAKGKSANPNIVLWPPVRQSAKIYYEPVHADMEELTVQTAISLAADLGMRFECLWAERRGSALFLIAVLALQA